MATTANTITDAAYLKVGIKVPGSAENNTALDSLNDMLSLWGTDFLVPCITRIFFDLEIGKRTYTLGTAAGVNWETSRPISIDNAMLRYDNRDYPLNFISAEAFNDIHFKNLTERPTRLYYLPLYPLCKLRFNCKPDRAYSVGLDMWLNFVRFSALTTPYNLPDKYKDAVIYNLAVRLAEDNSVEMAPSVYTKAEQSLALISRLVAVNRMPPESKLGFGPGGLPNIETGI